MRGELSRLLRLAAPLMLGFATTALMHATDAVFLGRLGTAPLAAVFPATMTAYCAMCFFLGVAGYGAAFSAQHAGAGEPREAGAMAWPGLFLALVGGGACCLLIPVRRPLFALFGAEGEVYEALCTLGGYYFAQAPAAIALAALIGFFGGLGRTGVSAATGLLAFGLNTVLVWALVFGRLGLPALGVAGAGLGTLIATWATALVALGLFLTPAMRARYGTGRWRMGGDRLRRFWRYAAPHGGRELVEILSWQAFALVVGHFGQTAAAATTIAIRLSMLCFIPMVGLGQAVTIAVGQRLGAGDVAGAQRQALLATVAGLALAAAFALAFVLWPGPLGSLFLAASAAPEERAAVLAAAAPLLLIAGLWGFGNTITLCLRGALAGAGDTRWPFAVLLVCGGAVFLAPELALIALVRSGHAPPWFAPVTWAWLISLAFVLALAVLMALRFAGGRWKGMSLRG